MLDESLKDVWKTWEQNPGERTTCACANCRRYSLCCDSAMAALWSILMMTMDGMNLLLCYLIMKL